MPEQDNQVPPPDKLLIRDETGQEWSITVRPEGLLQTAKYPDGEPTTFSPMPSLEGIRAAMMRAMPKDMQDALRAAMIRH